MASMDELIANSGRTQANWDAIPGIATSYYEGQDQQFKNKQRNMFKDGVPTTPDGQPDFAAIGKTLFQSGNLEQGIAASNLDLQRQRLKYGMDAGTQDFPAPGQPAGEPARPNIVSPPSANRSGETPVAPPLAKGGADPRNSATGSNTIVGILGGKIPDELAGPIIQQVSAATKLDPNAPIQDPAMLARVTQVAQAAIQRASGGAPAPQAAPAPLPQPAARPAPASPAAPADPTLGGLVPPGRTPQQQLDMLSRRVASGLLTPDVAKVYEARIKGIQDALSPTPDMKNAAASGQSLTDYQNRTDENTTQRDILTKSLLPRIDKSQEGASSAREEIQAIHRAREQVDMPGGIFSGAAAPTQLQLAKVGEFFGIANDKITNTEAFGSAIGARTLALVKGLGAGAGISNADRDFAAAMAGGNIKLDGTSIRRILDIGERAARTKIDQHNTLVDKIVGSNEGLKPARGSFVVDAPGQYQKPGGVDHLGMAREAIAKGAPRDAVIKRLQERGFSAQGL